MFRSARIKLTGWYLLIIMVISVSFSVFIYKVLTQELDRVQTMQRLRVERGLPERHLMIPVPGEDGQRRVLVIDADIIEETKQRLIVFFVFINSGILVASGAAGYFLAGRTLEPIAEMIDEQNRFVSDASHELRTPLTAMRSEIEVSLRDKKMGLPEAKKLLKSNLEEVNSLQSLSDELIKLAQYQKGNNGLDFERLNLSEIVEEAVRKVGPLAKVRQITLERKVEENKIEGNRPSLVELLVILLDNAIKYSPKSSKVEIESRRTDSRVSIRVKDQGVGISEEDLPHLFDRFYRADRSRTKSDVVGYGLGLSIARKIVDKHNGFINVQSKLGEGTTISVGIPLKHAARVI